LNQSKISRKEVIDFKRDRLGDVEVWEKDRFPVIILRYKGSLNRIARDWDRWVTLEKILFHQTPKFHSREEI
jgi:hypothetical protein